MSQNLNKECRAKAARPSSRFLYPRPPLRSFTKEMGLLKIQSKKALRHRWGHRRAAADFFGASSVASALGIRSGRDPERTSVEHDNQSPYPNQNCNRGLRSGCRGLGLHKPATRSLPKEDLGIPRQPVDRCCRANPAAAILDVPAWGATPRRSISDYDKEEKPGAFGYFLT